MAEPGNILVSASTYDQVKGKLDLEFDDRGEHQLKNIDRPVQVYGVKMDSTVDTSTRLGAIVDSGSRPVVAVLPFENMSAAMDDDYFADGLTEDIITALSRFRELLVIARNSTFRYKNQAVDIPTVGRELNASYVLEGSVRRAANRVRITAQLIRVSDGTHIWADRYDRSLEDIFDVQDEVTQTNCGDTGRAPAGCRPGNCPGVKIMRTLMPMTVYCDHDDILKPWTATNMPAPERCWKRR